MTVSGYLYIVPVTITVPGCTLYTLQWLWLCLAVHCTCCIDCAKLYCKLYLLQWLAWLYIVHGALTCNDHACCLITAPHCLCCRDYTHCSTIATHCEYGRDLVRCSIIATPCTCCCSSACCSMTGRWCMLLWLCALLHDGYAMYKLQWMCMLLPDRLYIIHAVVTVHTAQWRQLCLDLRVFVQFINLLRLNTPSIRP